MRAESAVGAIIVNYFKADRVLESVMALKRQTVADQIEIVVVDNSANAEEGDKLRNGLHGVKLVIADGNLGYTKGVNLGSAQLSGFKHILLVNPDVVVEQPDAVQTLVAQMEAEADLGVIGTLQLNDDGSSVEVGRRFPNLATLVLRRLFPGAWTDHDLLQPFKDDPSLDLVDLDWVQSSFTLVNGALWRDLGGLDELYLIFMADIALGQETKRRGKRVALSSRVVVRADGLRASRGGVIELLTSRALRVHVSDALKYQTQYLFPAPRVRSERA